MKLKAFVTGATGFVGSNLVHELHHQGWEITVLARKTSIMDDLRDTPVKVYTGDVVDSGAILQAMPEGVDAVFHVPASTNVWSGNNDDAAGDLFNERTNSAPTCLSLDFLNTSNNGRSSIVPVDGSWRAIRFSVGASSGVERTVSTAKERFVTAASTDNCEQTNSSVAE